jgi:beta-glucosidase
MTWPRTEAQVPINVGDADYQPQYPFGWGLRTDSPRSRLAADAGDQSDVRTALAAANWNADGTVKNAPEVLRLLGRALDGRQGSAQASDAIVSVARDAAQAAVVEGRAPADWAKLIADADHALLTGDPAKAFTLLVRAAN